MGCRDMWNKSCTQSVIFTRPELTEAFHNMNLHQKKQSELNYCKWYV